MIINSFGCGFGLKHDNNFFSHTKVVDTSEFINLVIEKLIAQLEDLTRLFLL